MSVVNQRNEKILLCRDVPMWDAIEREYAGSNPQRWKKLACLHLHVHCRWTMEMIGRLFDHRKGHISRLIRQVKRELRDLPDADSIRALMEAELPGDSTLD